MNKKKNSSPRKKRESNVNRCKRKFFGNIEYMEDEFGSVVEIRASNGTFKIKNNPFLE